MRIPHQALSGRVRRLYASPGGRSQRDHYHQVQKLAKGDFCWIMNLAMTTTVDVIYKHGKLLLPKPLLLPEKSRGNDADDVFNDLFKK
jgi:hypothetical protein